MKQTKMGIITMAVLAGAILAAGCITEDPPVTAAVTPATTSFVTPAAVVQTNAVTPVPTNQGCANPPLNLWTGVPESYSSALLEKPDPPPAPGMLVSKADLFGTPSYTWKEYKVIMQIGESGRAEGQTRSEISKEDFQGKPAFHQKRLHTSTIGETSQPMDTEDTEDIWYNEAHTVLYQHYRSIINGEVQKDEDVPVNTTSSLQDCSGDLWAPRYTYIGIDPVTVPAGTFPYARRYTRNISGDSLLSDSTTDTYWFASGIPVEVKTVLEDRDKSVLITRELTGWGGTMP
jgi:hypothetical protein